MVADEVQEELVDAGVVGELGVEGGGHEVAGTDQGGEAVAGGEGFDAGAGEADARRADEDHLQRAAGQGGGSGEDGGIDLTAVGVALDRDVEGGEGALRRVFNVGGEQDGAGAGAEGGDGSNPGLEDREEAIALEEFEHGGGFAAGHDEAVEAVEILRKPDESRRRTQRSEGFDVRVVGALKGEDADDERLSLRHPRLLFAFFHCCDDTRFRARSGKRPVRKDRSRRNPKRLRQR